MLVKSAKRYINTLNKILKNQHNDIITEITEDDDMDIFSVTLKFHIEGLYCFVAAFNNDDNVLYYVEGNGRAVTYIISDYETQKESMYTILNRIYDIVVRLTTETEEAAESEETEETVKDVMEVKQELNARFGKEQYFDTDSLQPNKAIIEKIENINHCPNQDTCCIVSPFVHCNYNYKSDSCIKAHDKFVHDCEQVHKQMKAKSNPEWHHVSLAALTNLDFDKLDKKRQVYLKAHRELKRTLADLSKCKTGHTYEARARKFMCDMTSQYFDKEISYAMCKYLELQLSMSNVTNGVYSSCVEIATGLHESRRYNRTTLTY